MTTAPPRIDPTISPSVDPMMIDAFRGRFVIGTNADGSEQLHPGFLAARAGVESVFNRSLALSEAERALRAVGNADPVQQRRLRAGAERSLGEARKAVGTALESLSAHRTKIEESIVETLGIPTMRTSVTDSQRGADVRSALRAMSPTARIDRIRVAMNEGDVEAVSAVLAASPLASGLTRSDVEGLRMDAERKFTPKAAELRDSLDKLREAVALAGDATESRFGALAGIGDNPDARAEAALRAVENGGAA